MTDEQKKAADAAKDKRIEELEKELATARAQALVNDEPAAEEDLAPTPSQDELDRVKLGEHLDAGKAGAYKTRQAKAG